jgi:hypothetical protein
MRLVAAEGGGLPSEPLMLFADMLTIRCVPSALGGTSAPTNEGSPSSEKYFCDSFGVGIKDCSSML